MQTEMPSNRGSTDIIIMGQVAENAATSPYRRASAPLCRKNMHAEVPMSAVGEYAHKIYIFLIIF